jgi:hypothetical protein
MAEELDFSNAEHAAGSTMAAFALAQISFSTLVTNEIIPKADAEQMLRQLIKVNETGGPANQVAAALLTVVLQNVSAFRPGNAPIGHARYIRNRIHVPITVFQATAARTLSKRINVK